MPDRQEVPGVSTAADGHVDFSDLDAADTVRMTTNLNEEIARIADPKAIAAVVRWLCERSDGWSEPPGGAVILDDRLNFSAGRRSLGNVGVGDRYMTAHRKGRFYQRDAGPSDREEMLRLQGFGSEQA